MPRSVGTGSTVLIKAREAGVGVRLAALLLDLMLLVIALGALGLVLIKLGVLPAGKAAPPQFIFASWQHAQAWAALPAALCALVILAWAKLAGTPGALLMGINVVRVRDGRNAGVMRCAWRLCLCVALVGFGLFGAWRGRRALHDRLSGTRVVHEDEASVSLAHFADQLQ